VSSEGGGGGKGEGERRGVCKLGENPRQRTATVERMYRAVLWFLTGEKYTAENIKW
jgi:hypothetical protein